MNLQAQNPGAALTIGLVSGGEYVITAQGVLDLIDSMEASLTAEANLKLDLVREQGRAEKAEANHRECLAALGQQQVARRTAEAALESERAAGERLREALGDISTTCEDKILRYYNKGEEAVRKRTEIIDTVHQIARDAYDGRWSASPSSDPPREAPDTSGLHGNPDAAVWARAFIAMQEHLRWPRLDEGTMLSWFANAMMAMHDFDQRKAPSPSPPAEETIYSEGQ